MRDCEVRVELNPSLARTIAGRGFALLVSLALAYLACALPANARAIVTSQSELTPLQREIKVQQARLSSLDVEERRDAVTRLGAMARPEASLAAANALGDPTAIVRATAAHAVVSLGASEASTLLLPLLKDRDEFVRREAAYALGKTRSSLGVPALVVALGTDKQPSVRGAAAVALGQIGDAQAVPALVAALGRRLPATGLLNRIRRRTVEEDEFVRRASAVSLGRINSREAVPVLIETLANERTPDDVRRESARALGIIGDLAAVPALRSVLTARDPYLARIAFDALRRISPGNVTAPG